LSSGFAPASGAAAVCRVSDITNPVFSSGALSALIDQGRAPTLV
jgi:hypothetical protein